MLFFFPGLFFFRSLSGVSMIWVNFAGKKIQKICPLWSTMVYFGRKKKTTKKIWNWTKSTIFTDFELFLGIDPLRLSEWLANFSWKKENRLFFFPKSEKKKCPKWEREPSKLFRGKNMVPLITQWIFNDSTAEKCHIVQTFNRTEFIQK